MRTFFYIIINHPIANITTAATITATITVCPDTTTILTHIHVYCRRLGKLSLRWC
jgi:hypothetical protein